MEKYAGMIHDVSDIKKRLEDAVASFPFGSELRSLYSVALAIVVAWEKEIEQILSHIVNRAISDAGELSNKFIYQEIQKELKRRDQNFNTCWPLDMFHQGYGRKGENNHAFFVFYKFASERGLGLPRETIERLWDDPVARPYIAALAQIMVTIDLFSVEKVRQSVKKPDAQKEGSDGWKDFSSLTN